MPDWAILAALPIGFTLWWALLLWVVGWVSGWRTLASRYPPVDPFRGTIRRFQHIRLGWANYSGCVSVGTNADGLGLAVFFLFRPGHPPIFVPWSDISATFVRTWFSTRLELRFARMPKTVLRLPERLGRQVAGDANRSWASEGVADG